MRSQLVFQASRVIPGRFLLPTSLSKGTRAFHGPGARLAGTMNHTFSLGLRVRGVSMIQRVTAAGRYTDKFVRQVSLSVVWV